MYMYMCTCTHPVTLQVYIHVDRFLADRQYRQAVTPKVASKSVGHSQSGRQAGRRQAILTQGKKRYNWGDYDQLHSGGHSFLVGRRDDTHPTRCLAQSCPTTFLVLYREIELNVYYVHVDGCT